MMWHTHAAIGASTAWLLTPFLPLDGSANIAVLMIYCVVGAMVADLDAVESKIKHVKVMNIKPFVPVSRAINREFGHRGLLHSLWGWVGWTLLIVPLVTTIDWVPVAALSLGYASHLMGDACTLTGIPLFYPTQVRFHLLPAALRIRTGDALEEVIFAMFACLTLALLLSRQF